jgi:phosphohistidine phosphatase
VKTKPDYWYRQSAAAPVRVVDGRIEVLLVTSIHSKRWVLPKGIIEPDMTPAQSAAKEAWEEAGVSGALDARSLGRYSISKWGGECSVDVFRMDAVREAAQWPEAGSRKRRWFGLDDARKKIHPPGAAAVLEKISRPALTLTLVRHAKSSWGDPGLDDFMRPLNDRGRRDAPEMGRRLREGGLQPALIVSSPAKRAIKTAWIIAGALYVSEADILGAAVIYEAAADELLKLIRHLPEDRRDVMLVGHNPGLTDLANLLLQSGIDNIPTCGVVRLAFSARRWRDINSDCASLLLFDYPKKNPHVV